MLGEGCGEGVGCCECSLEGALCGTKMHSKLFEPSLSSVLRLTTIPGKERERKKYSYSLNKMSLFYVV